MGITLTPLVDVVFILLLFFMLSSTFDRLQQISVNAPKGAQVTTPEPTSRVQLLVIDDATVMLDGQTMRRDSEAFRKAATEWKADSRPIAVGGREGATIQDLVSLLDQLGKAGLENTGLFESVPAP